MIYKRFYNDLYRFPFRVYIGTVEELNLKLTRFGGSELSTTTTGRFIGDMDEHSCNFFFLNNKLDPGNIQHEVLHATLFICDMRGIKVHSENDEPVAYLHEWIFNKVYKSIKKL